MRVEYHVSGQSQKEFAQLRVRWAENFLGDSSTPFDRTLKKMVVSTNNNAEKYRQTMATSNRRRSLWTDLHLDDISDKGRKVLGSNIHTSYKRLLTIAKAYRLHKGQYQKNKKLLAAIVDGMTFLNTNYYKVGVEEFGNWWEWELGIPRDVHDILTLMFDDVPSSLISDHLASTKYFVPKATHLGAGKGAKSSTNPKYHESSGGNRTDNAQVVLIRGILSENSAEIKEAVNALSSVLKYVDTGDGFYKDGSFIQHYDIAYNGSYGNVLLNGLGLQLNLVAGSSWQANDPILQEIYPIIFRSYEPLLYRGTMLEFVNGRKISRNKEQGHDSGHEVVWSILHYIDGASPKNKARLQSLVKGFIKQDTYKNFFSSVNNVINYQKVIEIVKDSNILERQELVGHFSFPAMDRAVHRRQKWLFSVAMHSSRLGNYEYLNKENRKGWYTGDGMTYLYNSQLDHYTDFWPAVDSTRLEGTTVDNNPIPECAGQRNQIKGGRKVGMDWVGTLNLGDYGVAGMDIFNWNKTLTAKKSWFMLDDEVVMLGSGISSSIDADVFTVIANRKLSTQGQSTVYINGKRWNGGNNNQASNHVQMKKVLTFSIRNKALPSSDVSYVFLPQTDILLKRETRKGDWADIGTRSGEVTASFVSAQIKHTGQHQTYAYVLLPNADSKAVNKYVKNRSLTVLRNDNTAHAVKDHTLDLFAANVWQDVPVTLDDVVTTYNKMSLMVQKNAGKIVVAVADPLQSQSTLRLVFKKPVVLLDDPKKRVKQVNTHELEVDVSNIKGRGYVFIVQ